MPKFKIDMNLGIFIISNMHERKILSYHSRDIIKLNSWLGISLEDARFSYRKCTYLYG